MSHSFPTRRSSDLKLGPALATCQNIEYKPWKEEPCKGPCGWEWEGNYIVGDCFTALKKAFDTLKKSKCITLYKSAKTIAFANKLPKVDVGDLDELAINDKAELCIEDRFSALVACLQYEIVLSESDQSQLNDLLKSTPNAQCTGLMTKIQGLKGLFKVFDKRFGGYIDLLSTGDEKKRLIEELGRIYKIAYSQKIENFKNNLLKTPKNAKDNLQNWANKNIFYSKDVSAIDAILGESRIYYDDIKISDEIGRASCRERV